jgi:hypothetical protein
MKVPIITSVLQRLPVVTRTPGHTGLNQAGVATNFRKMTGVTSSLQRLPNTLPRQQRLPAAPL